MLIPALIAFGLMVGVPPLLVVGMGVAALEPRIGVLLAGLGYVMASRETRAPEAVLEGRFHQAVSAELRSGSALRTALGRAARRAPELGLEGLERLGGAGLPVSELQRLLRERLRRTGMAAAAALAVLEETGGQAVPTFDALAVLAHDEASLERDRRVSTAQVRLSGLVIGGLPLGYLAFLLLAGRFADVARSAPFMLMTGTVLLVVGGAVMLGMLRSARRPGRLRAAIGGLGGSGKWDDSLEMLAELILIGLTAGLSVEAALGHAASRSGLGREVDAVLREGRRSGLAVALASADGGAASLFGLLARSHLTGAPPAAAVAAFLVQAREARRTSALEQARRLPVKLLVPLTLFILPGFVMLTVGPSLIDSLARVLGPLFP